jgi:phosphoribosyl-ATP pyrophosphohydrolase
MVNGEWSTSMNHPFGDNPMSLDSLYATILDRKSNPKPGSYTNSLLAAGPARLAQKVGEEAVETVVAALAQDRTRLIEEIADLAYHVLVLMAEKGIAPQDVAAELEQRRR